MLTICLLLLFICIGDIGHAVGVVTVVEVLRLCLGIQLPDLVLCIASDPVLCIASDLNLLLGEEG